MPLRERRQRTRLPGDPLRAEFRSDFDHSVPRHPARFGHSLRRERLEGQLLAALNSAAPA